MLQQEMAKELEKKMRKVVGKNATIITVVTDKSENKSAFGLFKPEKGPSGEETFIACMIAIHGIFKMFEEISGSKERAKEIINQVIDDSVVFDAAMQDGPHNPFMKDDDLSDLN